MNDIRSRNEDFINRYDLISILGRLKQLINAGGGGGGNTVWGGITGTLSDQTDLQTELDNKSNISHNHNSSYAPINRGVTNGDNHDHSGGDGAQIDHADLANRGINTHNQIDTHISAANPHSGHATLSGGLVPTNQLGSGTADNTKFLRGDQTWAIPSGGGGGSGIITGTQASRPAAGITGREFISTDGYGPTRQIDNGTTWKHYWNGFECTNPPNISTFNQINFGSYASLNADGDHFIFQTTGTGGTGDFVSCIVVAIPTAPYAFIVGIEYLFLHPRRYTGAGLCLTDGIANPKIKAFGIWTRDVTDAVNTGVVKFNSPTSWNSDTQRLTVGYPMSQGIMFFRLYDNNTNILWQASTNNRTWGTIYEGSRTDFLTPTHIGLFLHQSVESVSTSHLRSAIKIFHWSLG